MLRRHFFSSLNNCLNLTREMRLVWYSIYRNEANSWEFCMVNISLRRGNGAARVNAHLYLSLKSFGLRFTRRWRSAFMPRFHYSERKAWGKVSTSAEADPPSWSNWKLSAWQRLTFSFSGKSAGSACVFNHHNRGGRRGVDKIWCHCMLNHQVALWDCLKYLSSSTGKIIGLEY